MYMVAARVRASSAHGHAQWHVLDAPKSGPVGSGPTVPVATALACNVHVQGCRKHVRIGPAAVRIRIL